MKDLFAFNVISKYSRTNQETYYIVEMIAEHDGCLYHTYVSDSNYNSKTWMQLIDWLKTHPDRVANIRGNFTVKRGHQDLINADARFELADDYDREDFFQAVYRAHYA